MIKKYNLSAKQVLNKVLREYGKDHVYSFIVANILMIIVAGATALYPIIIDYAFKSLEEQDWSKIILVPIFIVFLTIIKGGALYKQTVMINTIVQSIIYKIQNKLYSSFLNLDLDVINAERSGALQSRIMNDVNLMKEAMIRGSNNIIRDSLTLIGLVISMLWLNWLLAFAVILVYPLATFPIVKIGKRSRKLSNSLQEQIGISSSFLTESFMVARLIKSFQLEKLQSLRASKYFSDLKSLIVKVISTRAALEPVMEIIGGVAISLVILLAGWQIVSGQSTIGEFSGFISALLIAVGPARALGTLNSVLQEGTAAANRVYGGIETMPLVIEKNNSQSLDKNKTGLFFKNVTYKYKDKDVFALENINLEINNREKLAIVGPSGSGKSSLINLIPRFFDPTNGEVLINNINLKDINLSSLRSRVSIVSQESFMFFGTVKENIALGKSESTEDEIVSAATEAGAHDFISNLPEGYNTVLGESGANLSGGEKQRIAIARAILKNPLILILDEPTSALDAESEEKIKVTLENISMKITTITIAHRISTIINSDRIVVLNEGKINAIGTHEDLMKNCDLYRRMALLQNIE